MTVVAVVNIFFSVCGFRLAILFWLCYKFGMNAFNGTNYGNISLEALRRIVEGQRFWAEIADRIPATGLSEKNKRTRTPKEMNKRTRTPKEMLRCHRCPAVFRRDKGWVGNYNYQLCPACKAKMKPGTDRKRKRES